VETHEAGGQDLGDLGEALGTLTLIRIGGFVADHHALEMMLARREEQYKQRVGELLRL
jgi:hypothetical protein